MRVLGASSAAVVMIVALLAGFGAFSAPNPVCGNIGQVGSLVVTRVVLPEESHLRFGFPAKVTVSSQARSQAVAEAACALPSMTSQPVACPVDMGIAYRLTFVSVAGRKLATADADATGCETVTGLGGTRTAANSPGLWGALAAGMGLRHPGQQVWTGT
jgi:hypothetical protein